MKKITIIIITLITITLVFLLIISPLAGCKKTVPRELDVYVWEGYLSETVAAMFEKETGINLNITYIAENGSVISLLKGGGKADIVMPTQFIVNQFYEEDIVQPLDLEIIANYEKVSKSLKEQSWAKWDGRQIGSGEVYAVPYIFGTSGLVVNTSRYAKNLDDIGWEILLEPELKGKVSSRNSVESLTILLELEGITGENFTTDISDNLEKIKDEAVELKNNVLKFYNTGAEILDLMKNEEVWISFIWDGGGRQLSQFDSKFKYILPETGGIGWTDTFMIPKSSENPEGANLFINFMLRPDIAALITEESSFTTTVEGALDMVKGIDIDFFTLTDEQMEKLNYVQNYNEEARSEYNAFWEELSTVQ